MNAKYQWCSGPKDLHNLSIETVDRGSCARQSEGFGVDCDSPPPGGGSYELGGFHRRDDVVLVRFAEERVHGEAKDFTTRPFGFREVTQLVFEVGEYRLLV